MEVKNQYSREEIEELLKATQTLGSYHRWACGYNIFSRSLPSIKLLNEVKEGIKPFREKAYSQFETISRLVIVIDKHLLNLEKKIAASEVTVK